MKKGVIISVLTVLALTFSSCSIRFGDDTSGGFKITKNAKIIDTKTEKTALELENTKKLKLNLSLGVAKLNIEGGSDRLMDGEFIYNVEEWKPVVNLKKGENAELEISQPHSNVNNVGNNIKYEWNLKFNEKIPFDIDADMGVGKSNLNFSKMNLERLNLKLGVGQTELDLSRNYNHDVDVKIDGGVGTTIIYLPKTMNINMDITKGVGALDIQGFVKNGSNYSYESKDSKYTINIKLTAGVGAVKVVQR